MKALADEWGVSMKRVLPMIEKGRARFEVINKVLGNMTKSGGMFFRAMELRSLTTSGLWSTFKDNVMLAAAAIGEGMSPVIKDLIKDMTEIAKEVRTWAEANKELIGQRFGEFVAYVKDNIGEFIDKALLVVKVTAGFIAFSIVLKTIIGLLTVMNLLLAANPIALIALAIVAVGSAIAYLVTHIEDVYKWFKSLSPVVQHLAFLVNWWLYLIKSAKDAFSSLGKFTGWWGGSTDSNQPASPATPAAPQTWQEMATGFLKNGIGGSKSEITIKDGTGRAEVSKGPLPAGVSLSNSGGFNG